MPLGDLWIHPSTRVDSTFVGHFSNIFYLSIQTIRLLAFFFFFFLYKQSECSPFTNIVKDVQKIGYTGSVRYPS